TPAAGASGRTSCRSLARPAALSTCRRAIVDRLSRDEWGRAVATLIRMSGDFDVAEEVVQDAFAAALERWPRLGIPDNPGAWIVTTAKNRAIDRFRRDKRLAEKTRVLEHMAAVDAQGDGPAGGGGDGIG